MADENEVTAPDTGITVPPTTDQPHVDPAAPDAGTTVQDNQQGTTAPDGDKAEREALYQTKYQKLMESQKEMVDELGQYKQTYGPLPQQPGDQLPPPPQQQDTAPQFDPYDPDSMKAYLDYNFQVMGTNLSKVASDAIKRAREEEKQTIAVEKAFGGFEEWCGKNEIPQELKVEAAQQYQARWGVSGTPAAAVEWMSRYIVERSKIDQADNTASLAAKEAAEKAKGLAGVEQPAPVAPPSPDKPPEKTAQEAEADNIAPDQEYVYPG